jgi:beta-glucosidase
MQAANFKSMRRSKGAGYGQGATTLIASATETMLFQDPTRSVQERVQDLLTRMTLNEKIAQLGSYWVYELQDSQGLSLEKAETLLSQGIGQITRVGGGSILPPPEIARMGNAIQKFLVENTRLGIPAILHEECCNGYLALGATSFPQMLGVAATWQPELLEQMMTQVRVQMLAVGGRQGLSPVLDISRDPRWGRVEETFGEDPTLIAQMGVAYVRGLQGENLHEGVMATAKHFPGHGISEGGLNCTPLHVGAREMREAMLLPFEAVIREANVASIMNAYCEIDGVVPAASHEMMTRLLREELGFDGLVVSDYFAVRMINNFHHVAADASIAAQLALRAGIDVELPSTDCYGAPLREALDRGSVSVELIDAAVERVLRKKFELGLFENPYVDVDAVQAVYDTPAQRALARKIATQSIVLLKNDDAVLPFPKTLSRLAVIGPNADSPRNLFSDYSHPAHIESLIEFAPQTKEQLLPYLQPNGLVQGSVQAPTILDAIQDHVSPETRVLYARGCSVNDTDRSGFEQAIQLAQQADAVIFVGGDKAGLTADCTTGETRDRADLDLPGVQEELVKALAAIGKPMVVVLVNGRPLSISWIAENIPAIVEAWLPGEEGGGAIADVLFGDANPGGKLPMTFPRSVGQIPIYYNHKPSGGRSHWHNDYVELSTTPLFPFGHGLSYTQFEFSNLCVEPRQIRADGHVTIRADVKNIGARAGDQVVQLYVRDEFASVPRPVQELKAFLRVPLAPNETRTVEFVMSAAQLAFYDDAMRLVVEPGTFQVMVGSSARAIHLRDTFEIVGAESRIVPRRAFGSVTRLVEE